MVHHGNTKSVVTVTLSGDERDDVTEEGVGASEAIAARGTFPISCVKQPFFSKVSFLMAVKYKRGKQHNINWK